jgi:hypothetical protein
MPQVRELYALYDQVGKAAVQRMRSPNAPGGSREREVSAGLRFRFSRRRLCGCLAVQEGLGLGLGAHNGIAAGVAAGAAVGLVDLVAADTQAHGDLSVVSVAVAPWSRTNWASSTMSTARRVARLRGFQSGDGRPSGWSI